MCFRVSRIRIFVLLSSLNFQLDNIVLIVNDRCSSKQLSDFIFCEYTCSLCSALATVFQGWISGDSGCIPLE